jgi:cytochrome c
MNDEMKNISFRKFIFAILATSCASSAFADANAQHGAEVFGQQCATCHSLKQGKNKIGPSLFSVVGRKAGAVSDYNYSDAIKSSGFAWSTERLDAYLSNPQGAIPGVKMPYPGLSDPAARADLIAFLTTLH